MDDQPEQRIDPAAGVRVEVREQVATITLDRPEQRNPQRPQTWQALTRIRHDLPASVRVVVIRGAGGSFSAGLDRDLLAPDNPDGVLALARRSESAADQFIGAWQDGFDWSSQPSLISIAAVAGYAIGAGFQLALGCDVRLLADDAQLAMAEPSLGLVPDLGGTKRLVDLVGYSLATDICLTGRRVDADEALRIGLASRVVARADLDTAVSQTVSALLAVDRECAAETKALLRRARTSSQRDQQAAERAAQYRRLRTIAGLDAEN